MSAQVLVTHAARFGRGLVLTLVLLWSAPEMSGQNAQVVRLMEIAWTQGPEAALNDYGALPAAERGAALLVAVADQLLWTGKDREAVRMLERAVADDPSFAEARFQQGRAALQRGDFRGALTAFHAGLDALPRDTTLTDQSRGSLRRRLENRIGFLNRRAHLVTRTGPYRLPDGRLLLFKFDPYINTFPALLEPATGTVRTLYPSGDSALEWRDAANAPLGTLTFEGPADNAGNLVLQDSTGISRATGLGITQISMCLEAAGASISGTLFRPSGTSQVPAVVLTHGAGLSSRYNLALEAAAYAASGVAAFVYDKPGLGESSGGNWLLLSIEDQIAYVIAAVELLSRRPDIGPVGVWGFSQGGWVAPMAAARDERIAFVVMASGAAVRPQEQFTQSVALRLEGTGLGAAARDSAIGVLRQVWDRVNAGATISDLAPIYAAAEQREWGAQVPRLQLPFEVEWWRGNNPDPAPALRALTVPTLALFGELDAAVPPRDNVPPLADHLATAPTGDYAIMVLPGASHQFMSGDHYHPAYFTAMTSWVAARFSGR